MAITAVFREALSNDNCLPSAALVDRSQTTTTGAHQCGTTVRWAKDGAPSWRRPLNLDDENSNNNNNKANKGVAVMNEGEMNDEGGGGGRRRGSAAEGRACGGVASVVGVLRKNQSSENSLLLTDTIRGNPSRQSPSYQDGLAVDTTTATTTKLPQQRQLRLSAATNSDSITTTTTTPTTTNSYYDNRVNRHRLLKLFYSLFVPADEKSPYTTPQQRRSRLLSTALPVILGLLLLLNDNNSVHAARQDGKNCPIPPITVVVQLLLSPSSSSPSVEFVHNSVDSLEPARSQSPHILATHTHMIFRMIPFLWPTIIMLLSPLSC